MSRMSDFTASFERILALVPEEYYNEVHEAKKVLKRAKEWRGLCEDCKFSVGQLFHSWICVEGNNFGSPSVFVPMNPGIGCNLWQPREEIAE